MENHLNKDQLINHLVDQIDLSKNDLMTQWNNNQLPVTRHFILDNFIPEKLCNEIYCDYIKIKKNFNRGKFLFKQDKKTLANLDYVDSLTKNLYSALHNSKFIEEISDIVGIPNLQPDPTLYAGGLTMMNENDYLNPHIDNSHDAQRKRYRRLNILFYITPDWSVDNGGNLELWDSKVINNKCIVSKFNRLVVMETNKISWHSVNAVKVDGARCCLSTYLFTKESPESHHYFHVTSFQGRPEQKIIRVFSKLDNLLRKLISIILKYGRR